MKKLTLFIALSIGMASQAFAQEKADIVVGYDETHRNWQTDTVAKSRMTLLANSRESKYFNDISLWNDSLRSTPEGEEKWRKIIMAACMTQTPGGGVSVDLRKGPTKKTDTYVFSNLGENRLRHYDKFGDEQMYYDEPLDEIEWSITDSTATVLGYECVIARTDYHGRHWKAWFAPEIPVPFGPWKLRGLPGLILKAESDNDITFTATGVENTGRVMTPMYSAEGYDRTERRKALADEEHFRNNFESIIKAKFGGNVTFTNQEERPKYDRERYAAETDYR